MLGKERTATYLKDTFLHLLKDYTIIVQTKLFGILPQVLGLTFALEWTCDKYLQHEIRVHM